MARNTFEDVAEADVAETEDAEVILTFPIRVYPRKSAVSSFRFSDGSMNRWPDDPIPTR